MNFAGLCAVVAAVIELLAAGVVVVHAVPALWALAEGGFDAARLLIAEGVLAALGFSLAATLLKVIGLQQWGQIRTFTAVFLSRTLLKQVFLKERASIERRRVWEGAARWGGRSLGSR